MSTFAAAQSIWPAVPVSGGDNVVLPLVLSCYSGCPYGANSEPASPTVPPPLPRMGPELALQVYRNRASMQAEQLSSYSASTVVRAELPDTEQSGEYELERRYSAPHSLAFKAVRFTGDNFVKSNVILRLLQSEASHVEKDDPSLNALTPANYKIAYKGTGQLQARIVHIYQVKPRHKRSGLFKGRVYLDAFTASMVRAEGKPVKSPSIFLKQVEFVQDYADVDLFTLPVHMHSEARARIVGRAVVDIYNSDYHVTTGAVQADAAPSL
ncbi:MAG TPA: hypothetical protein VEH30_03775 [Terriglobales bacterium]|nr:hypothetical protein [Terriglobales bacterium]